MWSKTMATLLTFVLAMTIHPKVVKRAQKELDELIGPDRLPEFKDRPKLPYVDCIIKEILRWNPPLPLGEVREEQVVFASHSCTRYPAYSG